MSYQEIYDARILQIKIKIQNDGKTKLIFIHVSEDINQLGTLITQKKIPFSFDVEDLCSHHKGVKK